MVVVIGVGDVRTDDVIQFYLEAMGLDSRVIDAIKIIEGAVGSAGWR